MSRTQSRCAIVLVVAIVACASSTFAFTAAWQLIDLRSVERLKRHQKKSPTGSTADRAFSRIAPHERGRDNTRQGHARRARNT